MTNPFARRSAADLSPPAKVAAFVVLLGWSFVVLFPIYWLFVTSFKTPYQVDKGPFYVPFVDFQPTLDAWKYILFEFNDSDEELYEAQRLAAEIGVDQLLVLRKGTGKP